jgi:hypothetical protein
MKYFAVIIIACCVILNFMIINDYGKKEVRRPVATPPVTSPAPVPQTRPDTLQAPAIGGHDLSLQPAPRGEQRGSLPRMQPPAFYRGIYLHNYKRPLVPRVARPFYPWRGQGGGRQQRVSWTCRTRRLFFSGPA